MMARDLSAKHVLSMRVGGLCRLPLGVAASSRRRHMQLSAHDPFAALLRALAPYGNDVVVIGGWVHALYLARASARGEPGGIAVLTDDFDIRATTVIGSMPSN